MIDIGTAPRAASFAAVPPEAAVTVVNYHDSDFVEIPWLRRLLREQQVSLVRDTTQTRVIPDSVVICTRLGKLKSELLKRIETTPGVVLYHISDEWYREPLSNYRYFAKVIRNYYHTALRGTPISQFPLGPRHSSPAFVTSLPLKRRKFVWSFAGNLASTRRSLVQSLRGVEPCRVQVTAGVRQPCAALSAQEYLELLCDSIFVPCAMGNANLESFRIYEALDCGAIPILERRPWLDYFTLLFGPHPLPSVCHWSDAPSLMRRFLSDRARLEEKQSEIREWWEQYQSRLSVRIASALRSTKGQRSRATLPQAFPGRLRGTVELLKHHNSTAFWARGMLTLKRLQRHRG